MAWLELSIESCAEKAGQISELLSLAGAAAVTFQNAAENPIYEPAPGATHLWSQTRVIGLFESNTNMNEVITYIGGHTGLALTDGDHCFVAPLEDKDWERAWMDEFQPMRFGNRLWVCPHWIEPPDPTAVTVRLDPGLAFGTGTHATTALCLRWLEQQTLEGQDILDYGCGSGILAIAAAKLGANKIWAIDHDPQALQSTRINAEKNNVGSKIFAFLPNESYVMICDILVANILARPLIELAPTFAKLMRPGGSIALSGILCEQAKDVREAYSSSFSLDPSIEQDGWALIVGRKLG